MKHMRSVSCIPLLFGFALLGLAGFCNMASAESVKLGVLTDLSSVYSDSSGNGAIYATEMAVDDLKTGARSRRHGGDGRQR